MRNEYGFETKFNKINVSVPMTRMLLVPGEGELEIINQGRFGHSQISFSQETGAIGQRTPRIGAKRPKLRRELSAGCTCDSDSTPHLFFSTGIFTDAC